MQKLIKARNISLSIGGRTVLDSETICCASGIMTALVGPSGCGKTTLLHCLGLLLHVDQGYISFNGEDVTKYNPTERRRFWRDHAAFVLQDYGIMENESVAFNVTMKKSILRRIVTGDQVRLELALEQTGLQERKDELASRLSGGEKRRLALARAIYKDARVWFVDEPTASLDTENRRKVIDMFATFAASGSTVIVSTHDTEMIQACDERYELGSNSSSHQSTNIGGLS